MIKILFSKFINFMNVFILIENCSVNYFVNFHNIYLEECNESILIQSCYVIL